MVRLLILIAFIFAFAVGFAWLADLPGDITVIWLDEQIDIDPSIAVVGMLVALVVVMILFSVLRTLVKSPEALRRFFGRRRRDKGYDALSSALIALGSGDSTAAKRFVRDAKKQLHGAPVTMFLEAQVAQQEDRANDARGIYQNLTLDNRTKLLGLHGLFIEARQEGEAEVARHYAEQAVEIAPHLPWAGQALFELQCADEDWEAALKTLDRNMHAKLTDRKAGRRLRAVLLTARAGELEDSAPEQARKLALEAHGLAPDLVPASVLAGRVLARLGDVRKATKVLEATWKKQTHPEIAESYAHVRPGDSVSDRLKRIEDLASMRANNPDGAMALAKVAINAGEWQTARDALKRVFRSNPTQEACLLMSELEEAEHGDRGRVREWLARAVHAPRDPAWTADGVVSEEWAPISPVTGRLDAFEWKVPLEELGEQSGEQIEESMFDALPPPPPPKPVKPVEVAETRDIAAPVKADDTEEAEVIEIEAAPAEPASPAEPEKPAAPAAASKQKPGKAEPATAQPESEKPELVTPEVVKSEKAEPATAAVEKQSAPVEEGIGGEETTKDMAPDKFEIPAPEKVQADLDVVVDVVEEDVADGKPNGHDKLPAGFPLRKLPDDPGPKPKDEPEAKKRFSLFS